MRNRLIELLMNVPKLPITVGGRANGKTYQTASNIADYLLANGVVVPPCKVGDIVWVYDFMWGLLPCKVDKPFHCRCGEEGSCTFEMSFTYDDFGKSVFFTREQAEAKLKEGKG